MSATERGDAPAADPACFHCGIEVPAGAQSGHEIRLRGKGVPRLRGAGRGDLHVILNVVVPSKLSRRERELLRELDEVSQPAVLPKGGGTIIDRLRDFFG